MTKTIYLKNANEADDDWWKNTILKTISDWNDLLKNKIIIKGGSYYPRLKDTKKRGLNAFNEVHFQHFKNIDKQLLLGLCKFKISPQVNIDTLIITFLGEHALKEYFEKFDLILSDIPFNAIVNDLNIMPSNEKLEQIKIMIENLEFTPHEYALLIKDCSLVLCDYHK